MEKETIFILISIIGILDFIALVLIAIDEINYYGIEKIFPIMLVIFIPIFGAIYIILQLKGDSFSSYSNSSDGYIDYPPSNHAENNLDGGGGGDW